MAAASSDPRCGSRAIPRPREPRSKALGAKRVKRLDRNRALLNGAAYFGFLPAPPRWIGWGARGERPRSPSKPGWTKT